MNRNHRHYLYERYPVILRPLRYGIDCGDGWLPLIDAACEALAEQPYSIDQKPPCVAGIKSKFGNLRFHLDEMNEFALGIKLAAESYSRWVCETTGSPRQPRRHEHDGDTWNADLFPLSINRLRELYTDNLVDPVDVPPQWGDLIASILDGNAWPHHPHPKRVERWRFVGREAGRLLIVIDGADAAAQGIISFAASMSVRIDHYGGTTATHR